MKRSAILSLLVFLFLGLEAMSPHGTHTEGHLTPAKFFKNQMSEFEEGKRMGRYEVSNADYKGFLLWLIEKGRAEDVPRFSPDFSVWDRAAKNPGNGEPSYLNPYTEYYFSHPAFANYPVVGITHEAATTYCEYLTEKYGQVDGRKVRFRLPREDEWKYCAGLCHLINDAYLAGGFDYPRDHKGFFVMNIKLGRGNYAGIAGGHFKDFEGYMVTGPVDAFKPTDFGLYNIGGNVAEMIEEPGIAKGGSWYHLPEECTIGARLPYEQGMAWLGFRFLAEEVEEAS